MSTNKIPTNTNAEIPTRTPGVLSGVRILDMSRILAGPYCTQILGDMGAEIIKVESLHGDDTRTWGPPFTSHGHVSAYFLSCNRNKLSIAVDLKHEQGKEIIKQLCSISDVLVENFLPHTMTKLGLGYEEILQKINARLIYGTITGFGPDGPYANRPGYDVMASAQGGLMGITGTPETPVKVGVAITDVCTGLFLHGAICGALYHRSQSGLGQRIDTSLLETQLAMLINVGQNYLVDHSNKGTRLGTQHPSIVPYQAFHTSNGSIICGALNDSQFQRLCSALSLSELSTHPDYITNPSRVKNRVALITLLQAKMNQYTSEELLQRLTGVIPCAPINNIEQAMNDEQIIHRQMRQSISHPTAGKIEVVGTPVKYSSTPSTIRTPPPLLGQHTHHILHELLGYDETKITELIDKGVIATTT